MTTNKDWLFSLSLEELYAWFDSEHVETPNAALHGDTTALDAKYDGDSREKLEADIYQSADKVQIETRGECYIDTRMIIGWLDRQAAITRADCMGGFDGFLEARVQERTAELDSARRDRETYRELLGQAIDFAYAITLLVDEGAA